MLPIQSVRWSDDGSAVRIVDQSVLPARFEERDLRSLEDVCQAIRTLAVRGAPAIGIAAAMGLVTSLLPYASEAPGEFVRRMRTHAASLAATRPTAVNLRAALARLERCADTTGPDTGAILGALRAAATTLLEEDRDMCRRIGEHGASLLPPGAVPVRVLTHCNAGALATGGIGTALAPIYLARARGRAIEVTVGETRPLQQGGRLTAWELTRAGIPVRVVADGAVASLLRAGRIDLVIVGADRIAANGDTANKIGTYALAALARVHGVPFYVAAPATTFDGRTPSGDDIPIEQRPRAELAERCGHPIVPADAEVENPAFDVTPAALITAIVSDRGVHRPPYAFVPA